jgi:hypothetical protein
MSVLDTLNLNIQSHSHTIMNGVEFGLSETGNKAKLVILASPDWDPLGTFEGEVARVGNMTLLICPLSNRNALALRLQIPWLQPVLLGLRTSAGLGDRLGLATPGHVRAIRAVQGRIAPIFAQQSIREMTRTGRSPQQVICDATWGVFCEGWHAGFGADADHLKSFVDIDNCLSAGFTFFTIDPGDHVDNRVGSASLGELHELAGKLPAGIQPRVSALMGKELACEDLKLVFDEPTLLKASVKYGRAILFVASMYQHLAGIAGDQPFEMEISVDETDLPTTHHEHAYIASELQRLGVNWVSLAPRYVGRFEKGVDYLGDPAAFEIDLAGHAAIARHFGPYKLSLHSGSDKFSIYSAAMRQTGGLVHLKTAGTSYLEALRTIATLDVDFFREIYIFSRKCYDTDKASYHVSAELRRAPSPKAVTDWLSVLEQFDAREILHVAFGSVLMEKTIRGTWLFRDRILEFLLANADVYASNLEKHFIRHLTPFLSG